MDARFWAFTGLRADAFLAEVGTGKCDYDLLHHVQAAMQPKRTPAEIAAWSAWFEQLPPATTGGREFFNQSHAALGPRREDIATWFDLLDLDDFVSFGGKS
jgi:hypothetical protein